MTEEKIKQGEELLKKLSWLKEQKKKWEAGQEIRSLVETALKGLLRPTCQSLLLERTFSLNSSLLD